MKDFKVLVVALSVLTAFSSSFGQTVTSTKDGNWDDPTVWSWSASPQSFPTNSNSTRINVNHKITVTASAFPVGGGDLTIDQTTIANSAAADLIIDAGAGVILNNGTGTDITFSGAAGKIDVSGQFAANTGATFSAGYTASQFNFLSGSTYEHKAASPNTALPVATYSSTSTVLIDGYTGGGTFTAAWNVPLGNVTYNCPNQAAGIANFAGFLRNIQGDLTILNTGTTGRIYFNSTGTSTAASSSAINVGGNFSVSGVSRVFMTTTGNVEVYVTKDFTFNSSSSTANNSGSAAGAGTGLLQVSGNTTMTGSSTWNFSSGANGSGTIKLLGNLTCGMTVTESGTGTSQGNFTFAGVSGQQIFDPTGATLTNSVNVTVNNASGVNLAADFVLSGALNLTSGALTLPGISLTLNGAVTQTSGSIATTANSTLIIGGSGTLPANLTIGAGSTFDTFEMNRSATTLTTNSTFTVTNLLLYAGTLTNTAGAITMNSGLVDLHALSAANTGVLSNSLAGTYDLQYTNNVALSTGAELPSSTTALINLTKLGTSTLTVTKNITINGDLTVSAGTITDGGTARTINLDGNYVSGGTASTWNATGTTFNFSGLSLSTFSGTTSPSFNVLNFANDVNISSGFSVTGNLTISAGKTVTASAGTCTFSGTTALTNNGTLNLFGVTIPAGGTLNHSSGTFGIASTFNINSTGILNSSGTILFNGTTSLTGTSANKAFKNITVASGSTFGGAVNWIISGTLDNSGTVNFTAGSLTVNGAVILQNSGAYGFSGISILASQSLTVNSDISIGGSLAATGSFASTKKVTITGANTMTGAASKTFTDITVNNGASFTPNSTYTITGNMVVNGTLNAGNSTTTFGGTTAFSGTGTATMNNFVISAGSTLSASMPITISGSTITNNNSFANTALTTFSRAGTTTLSGTGTSSFGAVTINLGTTLTPNQAYSVSGNLIVNGTLNAGAATFNGTTTISGAPTAITFSSITISGSLTSYSGNVTVNGNFTNNGTFAGNGGTIIFSALAAGTHTISGSSPATFNNINVLGGATATDVTLTSSQNLAGVLTLSANGVLSSGGFLTLLSTGDNPTVDASIAAIPAGANVTGNVIVQRYMTIEGANNTRIYRYISSPVQNATIADLQNEIPVTGPFTGSSVCSGCTTTASMFWYDESVAGAQSNGYTAYPTTSNSQTFVVGRGYATFVRGNLLSGSAKFDLQGPINSGLINYGVTYTSTSGGAANDGWNLVGNPYPSTIDWNSGAGWTKTNVGGTIYMTDNGTNPSRVATWNGSVGTNGGSRYISTGQAFFIQTTAAAPVLTSTESIKAPAGTQTTFIREMAPSNVLRITLSQGTVQDEAVIHFRDSTSANFDFRFDAVKLKNLKNDNSSTPFMNLSTVSADNNKLAINSMPISTSECSTVVPIDVSDVPAGTYNLNFSSQNTFNALASLQLRDNFTSTVIDLAKQADYSFQVTSAAASYGSGRFAITVSYPQAPSQLALKTADVCKGTDANLIVSNSVPGINYTVTLGGKTMSVVKPGTGADLNFSIAKDSLKIGVDTLVVVANSQFCSSTYSQKIALNVQDIFAISKVSSTSACQSGAVVLSASGAPSNGSYKWYYNLSDTVAIVGESLASYTTPQLQKPRSYYVSAVNGLGCEGGKTEVKANIINYEDATVTLLNDLKTLQSNYSSGNQWNFEGKAITGATSDVYTPTKSGNYSVTVSTSGCSTTSSPVNYLITAIESESNSDGNSVFPNPTQGVFTIQAKLTTESNAQIIDGQGKLIGSVKMSFTGGEYYKGTYDLSTQPSGIYLVRIADGNGWITQKVIRK